MNTEYQQTKKRMQIFLYFPNINLFLYVYYLKNVLMEIMVMNLSMFIRKSSVC